MDEPPPSADPGGGLGDRLVVALIWFGVIAIVLGVALIVWGAIR